MSVTTTRQTRAQFLALSIGAFGALATVALQEPNSTVGSDDAVASAVAYLDTTPERAQLVVHDGERQWRVSAGIETVYLDARTGELVEIEFVASAE